MSFFTTTGLLLSSFVMQALSMPVAVPNPSDLVTLSERDTIEVFERAPTVVERQPEAEPEAAAPIKLTIRAPTETLELAPGETLSPAWHGEHAVFNDEAASGGGGCVMM